MKLENKCIALATMRNSFNGPQHSLTWDSQHQKHTIHIHLLASQSFLQNLLGGPKISKLGHVTQATPIWGSFYIPYAGWVRPPSLPNLKRIAQFVQKLLMGPEIRKLGHVTPATPI